MTDSGSPIPQALLLIFLFASLYGLAFRSTNFRKERPGCGWNWHFAQQQSPSCDVAVHRVPRISVLAERRTFQRESSERTLGTGVGQDLRIHLPIRTGLGMASHWTRCRGSVPAYLEVALEQSLHPLFILNDQYHVHSLHPDLQSPASARNRDKSRRTPASRGAAGGDAFASFSSENQAAFDHVWDNGHALGVLQHFFRDSLVRHPHNFVHHTGGIVQPFGGIFPRRPCPAQRAETKHRKEQHYFLHGILVSVASAPHLLLASCCVYSRAQFRVEILAHQVDSDLSNSRFRRSEQKCSLARYC